MTAEEMMLQLFPPEESRDPFDEVNKLSFYMKRFASVSHIYLMLHVLILQMLHAMLWLQKKVVTKLRQILHEDDFKGLFLDGNIGDLLWI